MTDVSLDWETFSWADLKKNGLSRYARDITTDVTCLAWAIDDMPVQMWYPWQPVPPKLRAAILSGAELVAHNATFERDINEHVGTPFYQFPPVDPEKWVCTAAMCAYANVPRSLEKAAAALGIEDGKDMEGRRVMLYMCKPQRGYRRHDPLKLKRLYEYCGHDVEVEREIKRRLPEWPRGERRVWHLDQKINRRGVPVDLALCRGGVEILRQHAIVVNHRLGELSEGRIGKVTQRNAILAELQRYDPLLPDIKAKTLEEWEFEDETATEIAKLRRESGMASVKKMKATLDWADEDWRCRHTMYYYAAGPGRWGGRGPQFQNMKRGASPAEEAIRVITSGDYNKAQQIATDVTGLIASATRSIVCAPPGKTLVQSDYAAIEARVLPWIAGQTDCLEKFAQGIDLYKDMASRIYSVPIEEVTKDQRFIGKTAILGLGYGCGAPKFAMQVRSSGAEIEDSFAAQVVDVYRSVNDRIVQFWRDVHRVIMLALDEPKGRPVAHAAVVGGPALVAQRERDWMTLKLPSGRKLYYHKPEADLDRFDRRSFFYSSQKGRMNAYGSLLTENVVQGIARDMLCDALLKLEEAGCLTVLHVHDSVLILCGENDEETPQIVHEIMSTPPKWAAGFPLKAETETARRMK